MAGISVTCASCHAAILAARTHLRSAQVPKETYYRSTRALLTQNTALAALAYHQEHIRTTLGTRWENIRNTALAALTHQHNFPSLATRAPSTDNPSRVPRTPASNTLATPYTPPFSNLLHLLPLLLQPPQSQRGHCRRKWQRQRRQRQRRRRRRRRRRRHALWGVGQGCAASGRTSVKSDLRRKQKRPTIYD